MQTFRRGHPAHGDIRCLPFRRSGGPQRPSRASAWRLSLRDRCAIRQQPLLARFIPALGQGERFARLLLFTRIELARRPYRVE
jgi:hypothetical protein